MKDLNIDKEIEKMIKENAIGEEDALEAKTLLTWLSKGRKEAEKISKISVKNLIENGFVSKDGKRLIANTDKKYASIWFLLAIAGAKGFIKQSVE
jgi:hypothetical protein